MRNQSDAVHDAIDRWERTGLVDGQLAARLRAETSSVASDGSRRLAQYVLAATAALILLIAAGVFLDWAWPAMGTELRTGFLAATGIGVQLVGVRLEWQRRWVPASYLMQAAGLALVWAALAYSERAWSDATPASMVASALGLVWVLASSARAIRRSAFMPAVHLVFLLGFVALALDRTTGLSEEEMVWVLDGVLLVATAFVVSLLRNDPTGEEHPWALNAFVAAVYSGFGLVWLTAVGPLGLDDAAIYPLDLWLILAAALTLWGIHRAPPGLRREWFGAQLGWILLLWIPMGFFTAREAMDGPPELVVLLVGGVGVAGFLYGDRTETSGVLKSSALAFVSSAWYWGMERGGALGVVTALGLTAVLLFWLSGRWGGGDEEAA